MVIHQPPPDLALAAPARRSPRGRGDAGRIAARRRILDVARTLFAERGFAATRVADVARRAGMSPGNVYRHVDSKEAVLRAILGEGLDGLEATIVEVADGYGPARRKLELLIDRTIAFHAANPELAIVLGSLAGDVGAEALAGLDLEARAERRHAGLRRIFAEARTEGAIAPGDPDVLAALHAAFFSGLLVAFRARWTDLPWDAIRAAALRLVGHRPAG